MKLAYFILLLLVGQYPQLKVGNYHAIKPFHVLYDEEQHLVLNPDGTFKRISYDVKMCFGKTQEEITGAWQHNSDTLTLTDTLLFSATLKATVKRIFDIDDTLVVRVTRYSIRNDGKLHFISSKAGKQFYKLPDFRFTEDSKK